MSDALPPLIQEYRAKADQLLDEQKKVKASTKDMVDDTDRETSRMSGIFGGAAKAAAGIALGVAAAAAAAVTAIVKVGIQETKDASALNAQLEAGIKSTGNAAGVTVDGMNALASSIQAYSGQTDDSIAQTEALLLTFTNIKNVGADKIFDDTTRAAADMAARLGGDASSQAIVLGKALNDPVAGLTKLTKIGVTFTEAQKAQVAAMVAAGDTIGAQKIILAELNTEFGGSAEAAGKSLPGAINRAKRSFEDLSQAVVEKFLPIVTPAVNALVTAFQTAAPVAEAVAGRIADALMAIPNAIQVVKDAFSGNAPSEAMGMWTGALTTFGDLLAKVANYAKPILDTIKAGFDQLLPVFAPLIGQLLTLYTSFSPLSVILQAIMPVLPQLVSAFVDLGVAVGGALGTALTTLLPIVSQIAGMLSGQLAKVVQTLAPIVVKLAESLGGLLATAITTILPVILQLAGFVGQLLGAILPLIDPILSLVMAFLPLIDPIMKLVSALLPPLVALLTALMPVVIAVVQALIAYLVPAITGVVEAITSVLMPVIQTITDVLGGLIEFITGVFTGNWSQAWDGIVQIFSGIFNGIKGILLGVMNGVIDIINGVIGGIAGVTKSISDATGGAININVQKLSHLSFDVGTPRVPGPDGAPVSATVHGGEAILSNDMISGSKPIPSRVVDAVNRQQGGDSSGGAPAPAAVAGGHSVVVMVEKDPSAAKIARAVGWELKRMG